MKRFCAAMRFLTVLPVPGRWGTDEGDLAGAVVCFPLVGLFVGGLAAGAAALAVRALPTLPAAATMVLLLAGVSGGLHLDGLSDTADGFLSARPKERILEIMRDSHIGAMGVMAIVFVLLLKTASLASLSPGRLIRAVFLVPVAGRVALTVSMALLPYARPEGGLATIFYRRRPVAAAIVWSAIVIATGGLVLGWAGLSATAGALLVAVLFDLHCLRRIGGATGDTLGASAELAELAGALVLAGWWHVQAGG